MNKENGESSYRRFLDGEKEGLTEVIREYRDGLTLYLNSIVCDIHIAEELADEVFVVLYVDKPKYKHNSSFKTWIYGIGRNIAGKYLRKKINRSTLPIHEQIYISDSRDIEADYITEERNLLLYKALSEIKADYGQVLYLFYIEGFTHEETAEIMGKSSRQITDLLYRAKKAMKSKLEKGGFDYE